MDSEQIIAKLMELAEALAAMQVILANLEKQQAENVEAFNSLKSSFDEHVISNVSDFERINKTFEEQISGMQMEIVHAREQMAALQETAEVIADAAEEAAEAAEEAAEVVEETAEVEDDGGARDVIAAEAAEPVEVPALDETGDKKHKRHFVRI